MKKLIAIAVVFALVMGGVFAEANVGGGVWGKILLGQGMTGESPVADGAAGMDLNLSGQNDDGTFGGRLGFAADSVWHGKDLLGKDGTNIKDVTSRIWWKPIDMIQIQFGSNSYGADFGIGDANTGWGFYQGFNDLNVWNSDWDPPDAWKFHDLGLGFQGNGLGSGDGMGFYLSVYPISGLEFDLKIPFWGEQPVMDIYKKFYAQVSYDIPNIGKVQAAYKSNTLGLGYAADGFVDNPATIGLSFALSALQSAGLDLGFKLSTNLPMANLDQDLSKTYPLDLAVGAGFTTGDFNIKFRFAGNFLGKFTTDVSDPSNVFVDKTPAYIIFGLYPNYKVGDLFVGVGFDMRVNNIGEDSRTGERRETRVLWHAAPHVGYNVGGGKLQAGLNVGAPNGEQDVIRWAIPVRMAYSF